MMAKGFRGGRFATLFVVLALLISLVPTPAYAATSKTVKKQSFTTTTKVIKKKATAIKKTGTYKVTVSKGQGYIRFVAPKTKTYSFTFSNLKSKNGYSAFVEVQTVYKSDSKYSFLTDVKTQGGKSYTLWLGVNGNKLTSGSKKNHRLTSRTGKIKLKKGQEVYFYFYNGSAKTTANLKIK